MGMYTHFEIDLHLDAEKVAPVFLESLKDFLLGVDDRLKKEFVESHPFLEDERAYGFATRSNALTQPQFFTKHYETGGFIVLRISTCLKNYTCTIEKFLSFMFRYCLWEEFRPCGTYRYEESLTAQCIVQAPHSFYISNPLPDEDEPFEEILKNHFQPITYE